MATFYIAPNAIYRATVYRLAGDDDPLELTQSGIPEYFEEADMTRLILGYSPSPGNWQNVLTVDNYGADGSIYVNAQSDTGLEVGGYSVVIEGAYQPASDWNTPPDYMVDLHSPSLANIYVGMGRYDLVSALNKICEAAGLSLTFGRYPES